MTGKTALAEPADRARPALARLQKAVAIMPDYDFPSAEAPAVPAPDAKAPAAQAIRTTDAAAPCVIQAGTTTAGLLGATLTLGVSGAIGLALRRRHVAR